MLAYVSTFSQYAVCSRSWLRRDISRNGGARRKDREAVCLQAGPYFADI
ncbi:hypothetical protein GCM10010315_44370 [Streptomyces luteosporeus]|uniref:Uncharacterized protein n=1 Tax=Streptomyces luteosporeus TaxID=173856 RepID=A0ABN3TZF3_9ACTN